MRKIRILYSTINVALIVLLFFIVSYTPANSFLFGVIFYVLVNILLIGYFNFIRRIKCENCGTLNSIRLRKQNIITCKKCSNKIEIDVIEIGTNDVIP